MPPSERIIELAIQLQQVPAPTFGEGNRADLIRSLFEAHSDLLRDISKDTAGNVYARVPGHLTLPPLVVSAHLDTVFPLETPLKIRREAGRIYGPGLGDNSIGLAALITLVEDMENQKFTPARDIWLVANTREEGLGDLAGMKAVVDRFGEDPSLYLVVEGLGYDHIIHQAIGVERYRIRIRTKGGHSWADFGIPSAIHQMSQLVSQIAAMEPPRDPRTTYNVGRISGGTSINTIAAEASIDLDLRSASQTELEKLSGKVRLIVEGFSSQECQVEITTIGKRPSGKLATEHPLLQLAGEILVGSGLRPLWLAGSTDANIPLSKGFPALVMGITRGGGTHTVEEYIETGQVGIGFANLYKMVRSVAG